jgi:hypothetical protein
MQTQFPEQVGYSGFFALGFAKHGGSTRQEGVVIVKRTYTIDGGVIAPAAHSLPIFMSDNPDNRVVNSDFTGALDLEADDSVDISIEEPEMPNARLRVVTNASGARRVVQTLAFDEPLGGRRFQLSFSVRGLAGGESFSNVQLEAEAPDGSVVTICSLSQNNLLASWTRITTNDQTAAQTTFPADLATTEMRLVLRGATTIGQTIEYDQVQVEERPGVTVWNAMTTLRYENDLAPVKPFVDIIVLGNTASTGVWRVRVKPYWGDGNPEPAWDDTMIWLERTNPPIDQKAMFGWQPKDDGNTEGSRQRDAGNFSTDPNDLPPEWPDPAPNRNPLPADFSNTFYCGQLRLTTPTVTVSRQQAPPLDTRARIRVEIDNGVSTNYEVQLSDETLAAVLDTYSGSGPDEEAAWQRTPITLQLDTLTMEPERNRCYLVWRGAWNFDAFAVEHYRRLTVTAS